MPDPVEIWPVETGITDLPADWESLAVPQMRVVQEQWRAKRQEALGTKELETFTEQLHREWAIETGIIENLYDIERGVTMVLIEQGFSASVLEHGSTNKDPEYVLALINDQKDALEGLFDFVAQRRELTVGYIKELHAAMTRSQKSVIATDLNGHAVEVPMLHGEWKQQVNYPVRDGRVFQYCPPEHTASEMEKLVRFHQKHLEEGIAPEVSAAWLHHRFTQIHPFQDGNGRVARALASLVLIRAGMFPLVIPREEKNTYIESLEIADQGDLRSLTVSVARRQQSAIYRANEVLARLAPDSRTTDEAASRLSEVLANRDETQMFRRRDTLRRQVSAVHNLFEAVFFRATEKVKLANPQFRWSGWNIAEGSDYPTPIILGVRPMVDSVVVLNQLTIEPHTQVRLLLYVPATGFEDSIECVLLASEEGSLTVISKWSLSWPLTGEAPDAQLLAEWSEEGVRALFDHIRRSLA